MELGAWLGAFQALGINKVETRLTACAVPAYAEAMQVEQPRATFNHANVLGGDTSGTNLVTTHYYWYDGNGNVTGLMRSNGTVDASHRYTAFGGNGATTTTAGTFGQRNPYRFSTKYIDNEVETVEGTYYYGYRSYAVALGRWMSRDPIGEEGGSWLYASNYNSLLGTFDYLGLAGEECQKGSGAKIVGGSETLKDAGGSSVTPEEQAKAMNLAKAGEALGAKGLGKAGGTVKGTTELGEKAADAIRDAQKRQQEALEEYMGGKLRYWTVELKWECCKCEKGQTKGIWTAMSDVSGDSGTFSQASKSNSKMAEAHKAALKKTECP
jgi:RHS repeat-associated protein